MSTTLTAFKFSTGANVPPVAPGVLGLSTVAQFLKSKYETDFAFGQDNILRRGCYLLSGWQFDFKPFLKKYWAQHIDGSISQYYAPNKSLLRKAVSRRLVKIIEIKA